MNTAPMKAFKNGILLFALISTNIFTYECISAQKLSEFDTDISKHSIDLDELIDGGPGKDGIPSINNPKFVSQEEASEWIEPEEPVITLEVKGTAKAYPIQILIWHEIANDTISDVPVSVTFCPLCYSAIVFDRRLNDKVYEFGVSGLLRHSDMIMYDRQTESLWQQFSGEAVVGDLTGEQLRILPSRLISFRQFRSSYPNASVLSKNTGYRRNYGENPYAGYDDVNNTPFLMNEENLSGKLPPMEKVIGVRTEHENKAYPYSITKENRVIHDEINGELIVIFHMEGMASALDSREISNSRDDGSTGVFSPFADGKQLQFEYEDGAIKDIQTGSKWNIAGQSIDGPMKGKKLDTKTYGDYFSFAWLVFYPESLLYEHD